MYGRILVPTNGGDHSAAAARRAVDLVVMGTHGRTGIGERLLGSVTERVVGAADVPVLVTPLEGTSA